MSLLLDALQRASLDKERVASGLSSTSTPSAVPLKTDLQLTPFEASPVVFPALPEAALPLPTVATDPRDSTKAMSLELSPLALSDTPVPLTAGMAEPPPLASPVSVAASSGPNGVPAQPDQPGSGPVWSPQGGAAQTLRANAPVAALDAAPSQRRNTAGAAMSEAQVAREIRQAYQPGSTLAAPSERKRVIILAGVAVLLAATMASFFLGFWGDPERLLVGSAPPVVAVAPPLAQEAIAIAPPEQTPGKNSTVNPVSETAVSSAPSIPPARASRPTATASSKPEPRSAPVAATTPSVQPAPESARPAGLSPLRPPQGNISGAGQSVQTLTSRPADPSAVEVGYAALQAGQLDAALAAYDRALTTDPMDRDALLGRAYIAQQQGKPEEALSHYRRVLRTDPGNATAQAALLALDGRGDTTQTAGRARALAQAQPDSAAVQAQAGAAFVRDGMLADAAQSFARAHALEPGNALYIYNHAVALDRLGNLPQALLHYEKVVQLLDSSPPDAGTAPLAGARMRAAQLRSALGRDTPRTP